MSSPVRTIRVVDHGSNRLLAVARKTRPIVTEVGVLGSAAAKKEGDGITVGDIAAWAEYGSVTAPVRSWLRGWIDEHEAEVMAVYRAEMRAVIALERTPEQASQRLGAWIVGSIQQRIAAGIAPPNAPETIARKGSSTPLIDTGLFRSSITSRSPRE